MKKFALIFLLGYLLLVNCFCSKKKEVKLPLITTQNVYSISQTSAKCGAVLYNEGDSKVSEKGLCFGITKSPTVFDNKIICGSGDGSFSGEITKLTFNKSYNVRAYAI